MKKVLSLAAFCCLFSLAAYAQKSPDFSGTWNLDASKSQLGERSRVESMTLTVTQSSKDLTVATATKKQAPPADAAESSIGVRGFSGPRGFGGGDGTVVYSLDGKETTVEIDGPNGKIPVKYKATLDGGKASLSSNRSFTGPMGEISINTKETWSLSPDGKTLTDSARANDTARH